MAMATLTNDEARPRPLKMSVSDSRDGKATVWRVTRGTETRSYLEYSDAQKAFAKGFDAVADKHEK